MMDTYNMYKSVLPFCFILFFIADIKAQEGFFAKFSLGPGYNTEYSSINSSGFSIPTKNHAIGWGFNDKFSIQISDFGALIKQKVGKYEYINLDAFGLGLSYHTAMGLEIVATVAYSTVSFAHKWTETSGDHGGNGFAINLSIEKEYLIGKRWGFSFGPEIFWLTTKNTGYKFLNVSFNASIIFYVTPIQ